MSARYVNLMGLLSKKKTKNDSLSDVQGTPVSLQTK